MKKLSSTEEMYNLISMYCKEVYKVEVSPSDVSKHPPLEIFSWLKEAKKHYGYYGENTFDYGDKVKHPLGIGTFMSYDLIQDNMCSILFEDDNNLVNGVMDKIDVDYLQRYDKNSF